MSETKLLPCPFCGGRVKIHSQYIMHEDVAVIARKVFCLNCGASTRLACCLEEEAINAWNTRKPMDRIVEQLEMTADAAHDEIMARQGSEQYYDGYGDGVNAAIEIIKEEINSKFEEKKI